MSTSLLMADNTKILRIFLAALPYIHNKFHSQTDIRNRALNPCLLAWGQERMETIDSRSFQLRIPKTP